MSVAGSRLAPVYCSLASVASKCGQVIAASSMSRMFSIVNGWPHRRLVLVFRDSNAASCADRTALA